jgi:hypothetical protein
MTGTTALTIAQTVQPSDPTPAPTTNGPDWVAGAMAAAGVALIALVLLVRWTKKRRAAQRLRIDEEAQTTKERMRRIAERAQRDEPQTASLERLMVEAQELTRACAAQLDTRAQRLEQLIRDADDRLARLEEAQRGEPARPATQRAAGPPSDEALGALGFSADGASLGRVRTRPGAARTTIDREPTAHHEGDPTAQRVHELSQRGYSPVQIAQELGEQVGRVELMLALRRG